MSDDQEDLQNQRLPDGDPSSEGWLLKFVVAGVLVMLLYGIVTLFVAAGTA
jgi:hypothetical protein